MTASQQRGQRGQRREAVARKRSENRDKRWAANRYAVPYALDGPKVLLGSAWFLVLMGLVLIDARLAFLLLVPVAAVAGLQVGHAWTATELVDRRVASAIAAGVALAGLIDKRLLGVGIVIGVAACLVAAATQGLADGAALLRFAELLVRSAIPVGAAAGSMLLLGVDSPDAFVALVLLVSAYEAGDFLVGTGADNAFEGPIAGLLALAIVGAGLTLVQPVPFDRGSMPLFAGLVAIGCPLGQLLASALLPHGTAWAPALRRLDSYLIAAPLWVLALPVVQ